MIHKALDSDEGILADKGYPGLKKMHPTVVLRESHKGDLVRRKEENNKKSARVIMENVMLDKTMESV